MKSDEPFLPTEVSISTCAVNNYGVRSSGDNVPGKRKARGFVRFATMRTALFLIARKLDFIKISPHAT